MAGEKPTFSLGIEEEYLLVNRETRDLERDPPKQLLKDCEHRMKGRVSPEFMRCQIEVGTPVCKDIGAARKELAFLRRNVSELAGKHGLAIIAASTHPFAKWQPQKHTHRKRYDDLAKDMGVPLRRLLICANHVHVGIDDDNLRIDLMNQIRYLPAASAGAYHLVPLLQGENTKLKSYRLAVFNEMPRTACPRNTRASASTRSIWTRWSRPR